MVVARCSSRGGRCSRRRRLRRRWLLSHTHVTVGWVFNISFSLALVYASTWLVVRLWGGAPVGCCAVLCCCAVCCCAAWALPTCARCRLHPALPRVQVNVAPEAGGAGVAEVTAYLNGCFMPKVGRVERAVCQECWARGAASGRPAPPMPPRLLCRSPSSLAYPPHPPACPTHPTPIRPPPHPSHQILNIRTFAVKFLSAATAVGSGLPVGPEGPMIHMGAIVGAGLSQGHSTTLGIDSGLFRRFQVG